MSRIDHLAFRVSDRNKTARFFMDSLGYQYQTEFTIDFGDDEIAQCIALEPPEKFQGKEFPWVNYLTFDYSNGPKMVEYHMPPEIFISDGTPNSVVGKWVASRQGIGGLHHIAIQVPSVVEKMKEWKEKGYAEFTSDEPFRCTGLTQCFTKPSELCGVIFEFIEREEFGFCKDNVLKLMQSTANMDFKN